MGENLLRKGAQNNSSWTQLKIGQKIQSSNPRILCSTLRILHSTTKPDNCKF